MGKTQPFQFELMVEYMEKHGDLQRVNPNGYIENLKRWHELIDLLNNHASMGEAKTLNKWRKIWSDFKNNTKRKEKKMLEEGAATNTVITTLERRVLRLMEGGKKNKHSTALEENDIQFKVQEDNDACRTLSPTQRCFASVDDHDYTSQDRRKSSSSASSTSRASSEDPVEIVSPRKKRKKSERIPSDVKKITDRFFEYEREKDRMAHEQEMARIKQNEKLLAIVGRMVNVIETLSPNLQKYLDHNIKDDG